MNVQIDSPTRIVFHFNKGHLSDPSIPMWIVKAKGQTHYVSHVESTVGFNSHRTRSLFHPVTQ